MIKCPWCDKEFDKNGLSIHLRGNHRIVDICDKLAEMIADKDDD